MKKIKKGRGQKHILGTVYCNYIATYGKITLKLESFGSQAIFSINLGSSISSAVRGQMTSEVRSVLL